MNNSHFRIILVKPICAYVYLIGFSTNVSVIVLAISCADYANNVKVIFISKLKIRNLN